MKKETREEFSELIRDRGAWITTASISLPAIVYFLLSVQGKPSVLFIGLYMVLFLFIASNSVYVWFFAKKKVRTVYSSENASNEKLADRYPHLIPYAKLSLIVSFTVTLVVIIVPSFNRPVIEVIWGTPTLTPTRTLTLTTTSTSTSTQTPIPTSTPKEHGVYYMIVLDASAKMMESFDGKTKWQAALEAVNAILEAREEDANYGLVVIGGSGSQEGANSCDTPSTLAMSFSSRKNVLDHINQLQPSGGGSIFTAFNLAKDQFKILPENTARTLIFITGSSDSCESRDEWKDLERAFNFPGGIGVEQYSEIIVLEQDKLISRSIEEQFASLSADATANLNVQAPTNFVVLNQTNNTVTNNVTTYIDNTIASFPTNTPGSTPAFTPISTSTHTPTQKPGSGITVLPPVIITTVAPSFTPTIVPTFTMTSSPTNTIVPPDTATPTPSVTLLSADYVGTGETCSAIVYFQVSGSPAIGYFRVWNQWYTDNGLPYDSAYPLVTLPLGPNGYQVGLGGNGNPAYYRHKVWFEYNGVNSNVLDLICPNLTPSP